MSRIRPAAPEDLPRVRTIQTTALAEPWPALLDMALETDAVFLVLVERDDVLGYAIALAAAAEPAYVPEFAVAPDRQNEGLGGGLLEALCQRLARDGHETVRVTVHAGDDRARGFYTARGFEVLERYADHYEDGDGLLLGRTLERPPDDCST